MIRMLAATLAGFALAGCALPQTTADASVPREDHDYITGSRLPAHHNNSSGTKVMTLNPIDRDEMMQPKSNGLNGN
ncbi:MAG TPA: hypothetical protein VN627_11925 [Novosphingobium sp.]|nr:hypothetical protein [Novosphingobium sp.]